MLFSQRNGFKATPEALKPEQMTTDLRNSLWNAYISWVRDSYDENFYSSLWTGFYKIPVDDIQHDNPYYHKAKTYVRFRFMSGSFDHIYDFLEFCISIDESSDELSDSINEVLERELAAYRLVNGQFVQITDELEIEMLESALSDENDIFSSATEHIATALEHLSRRANPDYRNSIKESISAVESVAKVVTGKEKATLNEALNVLFKEGKLHSTLMKGYTQLYGYTSAADGIRHALMEESNLTAADAKYFLLSCISFVNYLKTLSIQGDLV